MREARVAPTSNPTEHDSPRAARRARVLRPWRLALLIYAVLLTTATHWPRLQLTPEIPASDKTIHLIVFGTLAILLWRSAWLGPRWMVALVALAWAGLDEVSQGIPFLHRTVSWYDWIANACGITCAMAVIWAMRPIQDAEQLDGPNQARSRLFEFTFDDMFATRQPWLIGMATLVACAIVIGIAHFLLPTQRSVGIFGLVVVIVAIHALYLIYRGIFFRRFQQVLRDRPCLECGAMADDDSRDDQRSIACVTCGAMRSQSSFALSPRPPLAAVLRVSAMPALVAFTGITAMFALVLLLPYAYNLTITTPTGRSLAPRLAQLLGRLPPELNSAIDLTLYMLLIAVVIRLWRGRFAAYVDRAVRCRYCGHDLHGTPVNERGEGHCGECGTAFTRGLTVATRPETADEHG